MTAPQKASVKDFSKWIVAAILVGALITYLVSGKQISLDAVRGALANFGFLTIAAALFFGCVQNTFLVLRIWALFPEKNALSLFSVAHGVVYGQLLNTFAPARAGDVLKAVIFSKAPQSPVHDNDKVTVMTGAGLIIADKVADMAALVVLIFISGAFLVPGLTVNLPTIPGWAYFAVPALLAIAVLIGRSQLKKRLSSVSNWMENFRQGLGGLVDPRRIVMSIFIGMGSWSFEAIALQILCAAQGFTVGFDQAIFVLCVLNLAIAVPVSLANLGAFEGAVVFALGTLGLATAPALAVATVHHGIQLAAVAVCSGVIALVRALRRESTPTEETMSGEFRVQLEDKMKAIDYFEKVSADYDGTVSKGILKIPRDRERAAVLNFLQLNRAGTSLMDVGCGAGFYSLKAKEAGMYVHSVDASAGMVMRLQGKVDEAEVADIEKLEADRTFDKVVCAGVLDFVMRPEPAFRNLCKLVSPGGRLVVLCPRKGPGGLFYRVEKYFFGIHINLFTRHWLRKLAEQEGLHLVDYAHPLPTNMALYFERRK